MINVLRKLRQEDCKSEVSLEYIIHLRSSPSQMQNKTPKLFRTTRKEKCKLVYLDNMISSYLEHKEATALSNHICSTQRNPEDGTNYGH